MAKKIKGSLLANEIIKDISTAKSLFLISGKLEACIETCLEMAEIIFKNMYTQPLIVSAFPNVYHYFRHLVDEAKKCEYENPYDSGLAELIGKYNVDAKILADCLNSSRNSEPFAFPNSLPGPILKPQKKCINEKRRINKLYRLLKKEFKSEGPDTNRFCELFEAYSSERRMLSEIKRIDVSGYPATEESLTDKFNSILVERI